MKKILKKSKVILASGLLVMMAAQPAAADSLYEYYTTASQEELDSETREMGRQIKNAFDQNDIALRQRQIDFSEYYSNLKKMVLFATKLAIYSEYETDLQFARVNEVFKGLPEEEPAALQGNKPKMDRKEFVTKKYGLMKKNVNEEIDTYLDLIQLSLDACETLSGNDLSGFLDAPQYRTRVQDFSETREFQAFAENQSRLTDRWPDLSGRISNQLTLWQAQPLSPDDPLINPDITGAI